LRLQRILCDTFRRGVEVCLAAVLFSLPPAALRAETRADRSAAPDTVITFPPIIVRADRIRRDERDVLLRSGFVALLEPGKRKDRVDDLPSVLSQSVGVRVRQYGGLGSFATVSIRGSSSNQVDVYLDGIPINDAYSGTANLADISLDGVESIEVYRGFSPPHLGSSSIGGVINLKTEAARSRVDSPALGADARISYGSFGTSRYAIALRPSAGRLRALLRGGYLETDGDFAFVDAKGTPENAADDEETVRVNNDSKAFDIVGRVDAEVPVIGNLSLAHNSFHRENGVPGIGSYQSRTARAERTRHLTYLKLERRGIFGKRFEAAANGYFSTGSEAFRDPEAEIGLARQETDNHFRGYGGNVRWVAALSPLTIDLFWEGKSELFRPKTNIPEPSEGPDRTRVASLAAASADLLIDRLSLVLSAAERFHSYTSEFYDPPRFPWLPPQPQGEVTGEMWTPHIGFRWIPAAQLTIKGNWGEYYRVPTFIELFGNSGSVTGSSNLVPEKGTNRDIGAVASIDRIGRLRNLFLEVVYLDNEVENLILFFPNSQSTSQPRNIGAARIRGWEISSSALVFDWLRVAGNYAYLDGKDTGPIPYYNGNDLPGRPKHDLALSVDLARHGGKLSYEYHRIGENYLDPANQTLVPARNIHNAALRWNLFHAASLTLEGRNFTDDRISDVNGFPLPGRSYFVTLSYEN
jgi:iron complex outermembrane receptor protein